MTTTTAQHNKSLDRSHGSVFRIKRDPAKLLGSAVARSTQPLDAESHGTCD